MSQWQNSLKPKRNVRRINQGAPSRLCPLSKQQWLITSTFSHENKLWPLISFSVEFSELLYWDSAPSQEQCHQFPPAVFLWKYRDIKLTDLLILSCWLTGSAAGPSWVSPSEPPWSPSQLHEVHRFSLSGPPFPSCLHPPGWTLWWICSCSFSWSHDPSDTILTSQIRLFLNLLEFSRAPLSSVWLPANKRQNYQPDRKLWHKHIRATTGALIGWHSSRVWPVRAPAAAPDVNSWPSLPFSISFCSTSCYFLKWSCRLRTPNNTEQERRIHGSTTLTLPSTSDDKLTNLLLK